MHPAFLFMALLAGATAGCAAQARPASAPAASAPPAAPNVLFIAIDDLRADRGIPGELDGPAAMPRIARFAETAAVFRRHFVHAPSCGPSRAALLTGLDPGRTRRLSNEALYAGNHPLSTAPEGGARTLPELMRRGGLHTCCIGKISHTPDGRVHRYDGGGDGRHELPDAWDELATPFGPWGRGWGAFFAYPGGAHREDGESTARLVAVNEPGSPPLPDERIADVACEQLTRYAATDQRFFLAVGFYKPHLPWVAPRQDQGAVTSDRGAPATARPRTPYVHGSGEFRRYQPPWDGALPAPGTDEVARARAAYDACVHFVDRQVGRVLDALDESGLADSTIVVLWSDHGFHLGESGVWGKHTLLDRSLRSPLMVRAPGVTVPGPRDGLAATIDLYPTLRELCGLEHLASREPLDGVSLRAMLEDPEARARPACTAYWGQAAAVRTEQHRLLARWRDGAWRDLRVLDAADGLDPGPGALERVAEGDSAEVRALLAHLLPPPGASPANRR